jgi:DNA polymerase III sliding clamp (beta) subunit (PCNA family)
MQFTIKSELLKAMVNKVMAIVNPEETQQKNWLSYFRICGLGEIIKFSYKSLTSAVEVHTTQVSKHQPFECTVPSELMAGIVKSLNGDNVTLTFDKQCCLSTATSSFRLPIGDTETNLVLKNSTTFENLSYTQINLRELGNAISKLLYATSKKLDSGRAYTNGIMVCKDRIYATNGYRLASVTNTVFPPDTMLALSHKHAESLRKLYDGAPDDGGVFLTNSDIFLTSGGIFSSLRLSNVMIPNFSSVIPVDNLKCFSMPRAKILGALNRALLVTEQNCCTRFVFDKNSLNLITSDPGNGIDFNERFELTEAVQPMEVMLNARYAKQALEHIEDETVIMKVKTPEVGVTLTDKEGDYLNVIIPLKLNR